MQIWCAEGNDHGVCVSHGSDKHGTVSPSVMPFVCTVGTAMPTDSSSEYLLMKIIKLEKLIAAFLSMKQWNKQRPIRETDLV